MVIGAGISGLACAFRLRQLGIEPLVLESSDRAGGIISTVRRNGFLFESGPQCPRFPASVWSLIRDLRLENDFVPGDSNAKRYVLKNGRLCRAPFSPGGLLRTGLVSFKSKYRMLSEPLRFSHAPATEETLASFVRRKFGPEVLDYIVDPIVSAVFLGDADTMGMDSAFPALAQWERDSGSLVRGAIRARNSSRRQFSAAGGPSTPVAHNSLPRGLHITKALPSLGSFQLGLGTLTSKLAECLGENIRYRARVESVSQIPTGEADVRPGWSIHISGGEKILASSLVVAAPAYAAARILELSASGLSSLLSEIEYAAVAVVSSGYDRAKVAHPLDGFGFMVPRAERLHTICTFWNSSLFNGRAPTNNVLITSFARGDLNGSLAETPEREIARTVESENARILGITGKPMDRAVWKYTHALPQYNVGHARRIVEIRDAMRSLTNFRLAGNFLIGRSIGECVESGFRAADELHSGFCG